MSARRDAVAVIGGGSVGSILAAHLLQAGHEVYTVDRGRRFEQIRADGFVIKGRHETSIRPAVLLKSVEELEPHADCIRVCFICTKTWALDSVLPALKKVLRPEATVVSFQNGIGPEDDVARFFPRERVGRAVVNLGCNVLRDGSVQVQWSTPPHYFGAIDGGGAVMRPWADLLTEAGLATEFVSQHEVRKRGFFKTILNASLSPLCASAGMTMREAMQSKHARAMVAMLVREGLTVGAAIGYHYGPDAEAQCLCYLDAGGDHRPSMWADLERGSRTEIEHMNGKIIKLGRAFGDIDVDVNVFFASMIMSLEIKSGARAAGDVPDYVAL
ncbi:MAG: ketopantoate reductase family protein [Deltaproteobacteria bacterium]|nr:ketopantoate reductase family protein [Deltaproteobacteria bacterium]